MQHILNPSPKSTINSYRSFGYNLKTALADIIDNSISAHAKNIYINFEWKGEKSYIQILDDGSGMNHNELMIAMTPGGKDPNDERAEDDLGRFGMGLKTASFSQCKKLSVITKKINHNTIKACWDIDFINEMNQWILTDDVDEKFDELLNNNIHTQGTAIIWEKLDRILGQDVDINDEQIKSIFYSELEQARNHIALVFHRFIEKKIVKLYYQNEEIKPLNPFHFNLSIAPEMGHVIQLDNVEVKYYILPHMANLQFEEYENTGGANGWFENQGFYIYRGNRLLVAGDWLGIVKKKDYSKLVRISLDIQNDADFEWNLDIKKSTATPPNKFKHELRKIAIEAIKKSNKRYITKSKKRISELGSTDEITLWNEITKRNDINGAKTKKYKLNKKHDIVKYLLNHEDQKVKDFVEFLQNNLPIDLILKNQNEDPSNHELEVKSEIPDDGLIKLFKTLYEIKLKELNDAETVQKILLNTEPFNLYPTLINEIK